MREKKKVIQEVTREHCEDAFAQYNKCISDLQVLEGKLNNELTAVKAKYEAKIAQLQEQKDEHFEMLQAYAESVPDQFADKKSLDFTFGTIGFRTGMPQLALRKGFKWAGVLELIKKYQPKYIRVKEEPNKEALLADRTTVDLSAVGLEVKQDETFYVAPNLEVVSTS